MIVCVGLNPALDRRIVLRSLELGGINRALSAEGTPGGKAANVAIAARALGARVCFAGFLGGPTGEAVARGLRDRGIEVDAETTNAATRINLELIDDHGVTEVLEPGSAPSDAELSRLLARCQSLFDSCEHGSVVAFSGSLPQGSQSYLYARLIELAKPRGLRIILDTSGSWLQDGIGAGPDFVKPNRQEAEALLGRPVTTPQQARGAIDELIQRGARDAVVSLGADGLVGRDTARAFWIRPPTLRARSAVGCGDSTVAGLAVALERGDPNPQKLAFAAACGAANCLASSPACLDPAAVSLLLEQTRVHWLD